jgi:hypothetical protein
VARLLGVGLARLGAVRRIDDIEKALRANLMEVIRTSRSARTTSRRSRTLRRCSACSAPSTA